MARITLLLPDPARFGAQRLPAASALALGRGTRLPEGEAGRRAQLLRHVDLPGGGWPVAALSRQADAADAGDHRWLLLEPAWLRPDINGVRLMGYGDALRVTHEDAAALLPALRPVFGDAGMVLEVTPQGRWYLRCEAGATLPAFVDPGDALGGDLGDGLEAIDGDAPHARRWRSLLSEVQIVLHNHPHTADRAARGLPQVNALWPWGGGALPPTATDRPVALARVQTADAVLRALVAGRAAVTSLPDALEAAEGDVLVDLDAMRDLALLDRQWLRPALATLAAGRSASLRLDAGDGHAFELRRWHRLRVWRRPRGQLGA